jgi:hypothetical protein
MADRITNQQVITAIQDLAIVTKLNYKLESIMNWHTLSVVRDSGITCRLITTHNKRDMYNAIHAMRAMYLELLNLDLIVKPL